MERAITLRLSPSYTGAISAKKCQNKATNHRHDDIRPQTSQTLVNMNVNALSPSVPKARKANKGH